jgi:hypothetical protein
MKWNPFLKMFNSYGVTINFDSFLVTELYALRAIPELSI